MNTSETLFFLSSVTECNKLHDNIRNSELDNTCKKQINLSDQVLVRLMCIAKLFTRLRVGLSHSREHKFGCNFQDPFCNCGGHIKKTTHFFLHCSNYSTQRNFFQ